MNLIFQNAGNKNYSKPKIRGFTLVEILIGCAIMGIIMTIIASSMLFHGSAMNKSVKTIAVSKSISDFYLNFDVELKSLTNKNNFKFDNISGNFTVELICHNPYKNIPAPVISIKYKKIANEKNFKYNLVKEIFIKSSEYSNDEKFFSKKISLKNADDFYFELFEGSTKISEYFPGQKIDKIEFYLTVNGELKKFDFLI